MAQVKISNLNPTNEVTSNDYFVIDNGSETRKIKAELFKTELPIGFIYMSIDSTNPSTYFPGTWERIKDTFLLAAGDTYAAGSTGGEATHTLTIAEMPAHTHTQVTSARFSKGGGSDSDYEATGSGNTGSTGGGQAHNNMPPYLTVYMWKRTA